VTHVFHFSTVVSGPACCYGSMSRIRTATSYVPDAAGAETTSGMRLRFEERQPLGQPLPPGHGRELAQSTSSRSTTTRLPT
jgi:hypothetical protein